MLMAHGSAVDKQQAMPPSEAARRALKRLVELGLPPTPENYAEQFRLILGLPPEKPRQTVVQAPVSDKPSRELVEMVHSVVQLATDTATGLSDDVGKFSIDIDRYLDSAGQVRGEENLSTLLRQVVGTVNALKQTVDNSQRELEDTRQMLADMKAELEQNRTLIQTDPLTGVSNRRGLDLALAREVARSRRQGKKVAIGMIDIDRFKSINDGYGHSAGDQALVHLASIAKSGVRPYDIVARYGGEEFLVILPDTDVRGAWFVVDRLRVMIENTPFRFQNETIHMTFSAGVAELQSSETTASLVQRADQSLYEAKRSGRNKVIACDSALVSQHLNS